MTDLELVVMGIDMLEKEIKSVNKSWEKSSRKYEKRINKLEKKFDSLVDRRGTIENNQPYTDIGKDTVTER